MAKEAQENDENNNEEGEAQELPLFSKKGKMVFLIVVVLQFIVFAAFFFFVSKPEAKPEVLVEKEPEKTVKDLVAPRIELDKPILISIPTDELATEFRHLAITLSIVIGRVEEEMADPSFDLMKALAAEQFIDTAENFTPWVKDRVNKIAMDYTYLQLQQDTTKTEFTQRLKGELNSILHSYGMKKRIREILLTSFIFSD